MQGPVLPSSNSHAQLEPIQAVPPPDPFPVDRPALAPEQCPDAQIAEPRTRMREIADMQPQGRLIFGRALSVPGCAPKLG
jgi:hypothetical protein